MHHGLASRNPLNAGMLARGAKKGIKGVFEQPCGYLSIFGEGYQPDAYEVCAALGER
jgi:hypothetical protein